MSSSSTCADLASPPIQGAALLALALPAASLPIDAVARRGEARLVSISIGPPGLASLARRRFAIDPAQLASQLQGSNAEEAGTEK